MEVGHNEIGVVQVDVSDPASLRRDGAMQVDGDATGLFVRDGRGIERVRYGDGWAWTRGGKILRLAARAEFNGDPPEAVVEWLADRGVEI